VWQGGSEIGLQSLSTSGREVRAHLFTRVMASLLHVPSAPGLCMSETAQTVIRTPQQRVQRTAGRGTESGEHQILMSRPGYVVQVDAWVPLHDTAGLSLGNPAGLRPGSICVWTVRAVQAPS
jgi:hypothetical protein